MNKIGIVYLATSVYKKYFNNFLQTLPNLFPNDDRTLFIISDGLDEYNNVNYKGIRIIVNKIIDLPYPIITACKLRYLTEFTKDFDLDYILYFDSDTIIFNKSNLYWEELKEKMALNKLIMSVHPHYLYTPYRDFDEPFIVSNIKSIGYADANMINEKRLYIITSFFAGTPDIIKDIDNKIYKMIGIDLANIRWLPLYPDEAYLNAINFNENIIANHDTIRTNKYITINPYIYGITEYNTDNIYENNFPEIDTIFINQKYDLISKNKKKQNMI